MRAAASSATLPASGSCSPARISSSVDLPQPDAPTIATTSPACTDRSIAVERDGVAEPARQAASLDGCSETE